MFNGLNIKVKKLRESNNLSKFGMSEILGVETRTYDKIENGQRQLSLSEIELICNKFSLNPEEFLFGEPKLVFTNSINNGVVHGGNNNVFNLTDFDKVKSIFESYIKSKDDTIRLLEDLITVLKK